MRLTIAAGNTIMNAVKNSKIDNSLGNRQDLILNALRNALDLLGGPEQTERVFRYLQNEYALLPASRQGVDEKTIATALTNLFGRGSELLLGKFREEIERSEIPSSESRSSKESDFGKITRSQFQASGKRK